MTFFLWTLKILSQSGTILSLTPWKIFRLCLWKIVQIVIIAFTLGIFVYYSFSCHHHFLSFRSSALQPLSLFTHSFTVPKTIYCFNELLPFSIFSFFIIYILIFGPELDDPFPLHNFSALLPLSSSPRCQFVWLVYQCRHIFLLDIPVIRSYALLWQTLLHL